MRTKTFLHLLLALPLLPIPTAVAQEPDLVRIEELSKAGETLDVDVTARFPLPEQRVGNDTGINVLVDLSHQATFAAMWRLPPRLRSHGFRSVGSQASLDHVLTPGRPNRIRIHAGDRRPFAWWPAARFDVVVTLQSSAEAQDYLDEEVEALRRHVEGGGGLILVGGRAGSGDDELPLNRLAETFGATIVEARERYRGVSAPALDLGSGWERWIDGEGGAPVIGRRQLGEGRVILLGAIGLLHAGSRERGWQDELLAEAVRWVAGGSPPVGGTRRLPLEASGGGPIYPELEKRIGNVVVYYARNQRQHLLDTILEDMPRVKEKVEGWLPSRPADEPMFLVLSAGGGGGWAVNAYRPKEVGIISLTREGVLSVFAHELAHTMGGPPNDRGELAGHWAHGNQGESHAGWFQGKAAALDTGERVSHDPDQLFSFDADGDGLDLAASSADNRERWGKGRDWTKIWWVWQKLDDRYGPTWYPRWRWVQHTRWQDSPDRRLSWDEVVEDMSIAVGEDLFPFFQAIGTTLGKDRFPRASFRGEKLDLPVAPLEISPAGPVRLEPIGDYRQPLRIERERG